VTVRFECTTHVHAPVDRVFDAALDIDLHIASMAGSGERAIAGVTSGLIGLNEEVTWRARHVGIRWTMTSRIVELERPRRFVDQQVRGPFARFRHEHLFREVGGGTEMRDRVVFAAPWGALGWAVERAVLARYVRGLIERRNGYLAGRR
jgi:ligand-binding SRPBCC domain-containing protein